MTRTKSLILTRSVCSYLVGSGSGTKSGGGTVGTIGSVGTKSQLDRKQQTFCFTVNED